MEVIPNLTDLGPAIIRRVCPRSRAVVARPAAANVRQGTVTSRQGALEVDERVRSRVAGCDAGVGEEPPGGQAAVVKDGRLEKVDDFLVRDVVGAVAGDVKGGEAGGVFAELVGPEVGVWRALVDPVSVCVNGVLVPELLSRSWCCSFCVPVHVVEEVVAVKGCDQLGDVWAIVCGDNGA